MPHVSFDGSPSVTVPGPVADGRAGRPSAMFDLDEPLVSLAAMAQQSIPGVHGAGATLVQDGVPVYRSSNDFSGAVDQVQYRLGEGPCVDAVLQERTTGSGTIAVGEKRWPRFDHEVQTLQVRSVLSIPLTVDDHVIGSINLYSHDTDAFDEEAIAAAEDFAGPAASSLSATRLLMETLDACDFASYDLADRAVVEMAIGVLIGRHHVPAEEARRRLEVTAASAGRTLKATAAEIVADPSVRSTDQL